jgi:hypothetical protein
MVAYSSKVSPSKLELITRQFGLSFSRVGLIALLLLNLFCSQWISSEVEASPMKASVDSKLGSEIKPGTASAKLEARSKPGADTKPGTASAKLEARSKPGADTKPGTLNAKKKVLRIEQKTVGYGATTILIADDGIQFAIKTKGLKYYCLGPKWLLVIHNPKLNLAKEEQMRAWKGTSISKERITEISRTESSSSLYSLPGKRVKLEIAPVDSYFSKAEAMFRTSTRSAKKFQKMEYFVSDSIRLSKEQKLLADYVYGMTGAGGVILKEDLIDGDGKRFPIIETESIKEDWIPLSDWIYPKGYKAASWQELLNQKKDLEDAASILDTLYDGK